MQRQVSHDNAMRGRGKKAKPEEERKAIRTPGEEPVYEHQVEQGGALSEPIPTAARAKAIVAAKVGSECRQYSMCGTFGIE